jgi:xylulokinase
MTRDAMTPANLARASIEGMLCGLADAVDALRVQGVVPARILLVGGAAGNAAVQEVATTVFDLPVVVPPPGEYVADGAARQAAWALSGGGEPPAWELAGEIVRDPAPVEAVREAYAAARRTVHGA